LGHNVNHHFQQYSKLTNPTKHSGSCFTTFSLKRITEFGPQTVRFSESMAIISLKTINRLNFINETWCFLWGRQ